jgi:hypothetical protein
MPWDYMRSVKVAGAAAAVDYVVGSKLVDMMPASATSDDNTKSALRTGLAVMVADLVMQNIS